MSAEWPTLDAWKLELLSQRPDMEQRQLVGEQDGDGADLLALMERAGGRCWYCGCHLTFGGASVGTSITREHLVPKARGGSNAAENIVGSCRACNIRKQAKTVEEYRAAMGGIVFYGERAP